VYVMGVSNHNFSS